MTRKQAKEATFYQEITEHISGSPVNPLTKFMNFPRFTDRQHLTKFLARHELYRKILNVQGSIIECGVMNGGGLFTWGQLSALHEPYNYNRKIVGFDTFENNFESLMSEKDKGSVSVGNFSPYSSYGNSFNDIKDSIRIFDMNRSVGHVEKIELVKGNATETIPTYINKNPHLVVALLNLDFDLYEPTKTALHEFLPLMPKGAVIIFDDIGNPRWPGVTSAAKECFDFNKIRLQRFEFEPMLSYAIIE